MKKRFFVLPLMGLMTLGFVACGDDKEGDGNDTPSNELVNSDDADKYLGSLVVTNADGSAFANDASECIAVEGASLTLVMLQAKFSERMPLTLDSVKISGIEYTKENDVLSFAAESIVPLWNNAPFATYTVKDLKGTIEADSLKFTATMGSYPISYKGLKK